MATIELRSNSAVEMRRGILLMTAGSLLIPVLDTTAKLLTERHGLSPGEIGFLRFVLQTGFALPLVVLFHGTRALWPRRPLLNLARGVLLGMATICFFTALKFMPLADATAIFFVEPVIVTVLSALLLKERIGAARIVAVLVGFLGTVIVIRPNFLALGAIAVLPLLTALLVALYAILNRRLADTGTPLTMHFYTGLGGGLFLLPTLLIGNAFGLPELSISMPREPVVLVLFLVIGLVATVAHLMFMKAYHDAPASLLAPLGYLEIPSAVLMGLFVFNDFPDPITLCGIGVIALSGLMLVTMGRRPAPVPPPLQT